MNLSNRHLPSKSYSDNDQGQGGISFLSDVTISMYSVVYGASRDRNVDMKNKRIGKIPRVCSPFRFVLYKKILCAVLLVCY